MVLLVGFFLTGSSNICQAAQLTQEGQSYFDAKITILKSQFPNGKYWNHVGMATDNSNGYTNSPCTEHKNSGVNHTAGSGGCTCNHFAGGGHVSSTQCMGYANKLGYEVFGNTTWKSRTDNPTANVQVGDILRYSSASENTVGHSVFVIAKSGSLIAVGEANWGGACQIKWDRMIDLSKVTVVNYEHAANYASIMGTAAATSIPASDKEVSPSGQSAVNNATTTGNESISSAGTTDSTKTGWILAGDGVHYCYLKNGVVQKKKWITISKKKYYVDQNGYRLTGFGDIGSYTYYFAEDGVCLMSQWFDVGKESYYANESGIVLKSQWLYKNSVKVYVTSDGSVAKNEIVKIDGKSYYFNAKGKRSKGFKKYKGGYYYCNKSGVVQKKKWITLSGKKYYLQKSGVRAQNQLLKVGKHYYYFNAKGQMVKKKNVEYAGILYKADKQGHCKIVQYASPKE